MRQGITTFIGGNCGMSMAPIGKKHFESSKAYIEMFTALDIEKDINWRNTAEFFDVIDTDSVISSRGKKS